MIDKEFISMIFLMDSPCYQNQVDRIECLMCSCTLASKWELLHTFYLMNLVVITCSILVRSLVFFSIDPICGITYEFDVESLFPMHNLRYHKI